MLQMIPIQSVVITSWVVLLPLMYNPFITMEQFHFQAKRKKMSVVYNFLIISAQILFFSSSQFHKLDSITQSV